MQVLEAPRIPLGFHLTWGFGKKALTPTVHSLVGLWVFVVPTHGVRMGRSAPHLLESLRLLAGEDHFSQLEQRQAQKHLEGDTAGTAVPCAAPEVSGQWQRSGLAV